MRKYIAAAAGVLAAAACFVYLLSVSSGAVEAEKKSGDPTVVASIFPYYDFARAVGGDHISLSLLLKPGMESHNYDPSPQDMLSIAKSDLFIYTGGENDLWAKKVGDAANEGGHAARLAAISCVRPLDEEEAGHDHGEEAHHETDEHIWTSPKNAIKIAEAIKEALCRAAPQNRGHYQYNYETYAAKLRALDADYTETVRRAKRKTLVFGDRYPFRYLDEDYGLHAEAAFPGCASETEANAAVIARLIDKVKEEKIPVVFHIELSNENTSDAICRETGAKKRLLHSCHNLSLAEMQGGVTYIGLMRKNLESLKEALN